MTCPHGHPELALHHMFTGAQATKPCPKCGKVPEFIGLAMSIDMLGGKVTGTDGQEYTACPNCGSDFLDIELEPPSFHGVLRCLDCDAGTAVVLIGDDWEPPREPLDVHPYVVLMQEIRERTEFVSQLLQADDLADWARLESVCLQIRKLLELVMFSSLVANQDLWERSQKELRSSQNIAMKFRELERLHPNFYPTPVDLNRWTGREPATRTEGFLNKNDFQKFYGMLGNILHADNPLGRPTDYGSFIKVAPGLIESIQNLMECHKVHLYDHPNEFYLVKMFGDLDGEVTFIRFSTDSEGETLCAWPDCSSWAGRQYCEYIGRPWRECVLPEKEPAQTEGKQQGAYLDRFGMQPPWSVDATDS